MQRYHFEQFGEVVSVEVMKDRNTGDPRGFAFVVFKEDATVDLVMQNLPHEINHKVVDVKRAQARGTAPPSIHHGGEGGGAAGSGGSTGANHGLMQNSGQGKNRGMNQTGGIIPGGTKELTPEQLQNKIFVGGLPMNLNKDGLRDFFNQFGKVVDAIVLMDASQTRSRGFGFVTFENGSGGAQKALKEQPLYIEDKYVEIKLATPKGDAQQGPGIKRYQNQNHSGGLRNANAAEGIANQPKGEFSGLAASFGRNGWRAGYGTMAFGSGGWAVRGWEDAENAPERSGFSFTLLDKTGSNTRTKRTSRNGNQRDRSVSHDFDSSRENKRSRYS